MSAHTPIPWTYDEHGGTFYVWGPGQAMVADGEMEEAYLARMRGVGRKATPEEQEANAAFIVRACNSHEALLEAAKGVDVLYAELRAAMPTIANTPAFDLVCESVRRARSAIAKAEGRS